MRQIAVEHSEDLVLTALTHLKDGRIMAAVACFVDEFTFHDHGIGLQFKDKERLTEFFQKTRELYPDSSLQTEKILVSGDSVVTEWTLRVTLTEPFYGRLSRKVPISLQGASVVRTKGGKIADWADYYDGLTSRRTAPASYFTEWVEL